VAQLPAGLGFSAKEPFGSSGSPGAAGGDPGGDPGGGCGHAAQPRERELLRAAVARLGREDLSTLPAFERAHAALRDAGDAGGALLAAACAVQVIAAAYADFRDATAWVERLHEAQPALETLDAHGQLIVCSAIVSAAVIVDTTGFDAPEVSAALEQALRLLPRVHGEHARDDVVAAARALLEYCEQQGQPDTYHRIVEAADARCASGPVAPLILGRYWIYLARCRFRLGAYQRDKANDAEALALLSRVDALGAAAALPQLQFDARYARLLLAAIRNDVAAMRGLVGQLHEVLDYARPNCVALYYQHLARVHLMHDEVAPAFEAASHALRAARVAACVSGERRSYQVMQALALLANGEPARAIAEIESTLQSVSGRPRAILACTAGFAEAWRARVADAADYRERLQRAIRQAEELNWPLFLNSLPRIAAQIAADALRFEIGGELVHRAIALRGLAPPADADDRWPWPVRIHTLGRFAVLIDGQPLSFAGKAQRKPLEILKSVVALGGRDVDVGQVIDRLWPELEGDAGRNAFDTALHRLRKLLRHDDVIATRDRRLDIDTTRVWIDCRAFELVCAQVDEAGTPAGRELAARLLRLYAGHFLAGDDAAWLLGMRERLRSKLLRALSTLGERLERQGDRDEAIVLYRRAVEVDPLVEEFHRRLMLCYRAQNRIAEALDAYRHCRDLISITLGVEPSSATQAVYRSLKSA
jgi:DNA-binding SARP family transcriptional activator